ncbi:MAG: carbohydrate ABC transporter permease [Actinobacteria bacterium]|nr:carbohydrate ABC transporter permease [Bacillota bacterium]MCL5045876.1 carbohydrate ABC transporter permease [Actinomycetota bacterium]
MAQRAAAVRRVEQVTQYAVLLIIAFFILIPLYWMVITALKERNEVFALPIKWWPSRLHWENFAEGLSQRPFGQYFWNSLMVTSVITVGTVFFSALAGYSLAKFHYRGRQAFFLLILSTMMIPFQVVMLPLYLLVRQLGWLNTYWGLIVPYAMSAFGVFLMRQHILQLPDDFIHAARIDGCSEFGIFWRIILPMSRPAISALAIFTFMLNWDNFLWPLMVVSKDTYRTLPLGIMFFENAYQTQYHLLMAVSLLSMLPVLIVFFILQREFINGMVASGLKD